MLLCSNVDVVLQNLVLALLFSSSVVQLVRISAKAPLPLLLHSILCVVLCCYKKLAKEHKKQSVFKARVSRFATSLRQCIKYHQKQKHKNYCFFTPIVSIVYLFGINIIRRTSLSGRVSNSILLGKQYSLVQTRRLIASSCNFPSSLLGFLWPLAAFAYLVSLG